MLAEGRLQRREALVARETFDGGDLRALGLHREHEARAHCRAVDQHRAGAADAVLAADMRAGEAEVMAQAVGERQPRLDADFDLFAVDFESYGHGDLTLLACRALERALDQ